MLNLLLIRCFYVELWLWWLRDVPAETLIFDLLCFSSLIFQTQRITLLQLFESGLEFFEDECKVSQVVALAVTFTVELFIDYPVGGLVRLINVISRVILTLQGPL